MGEEDPAQADSSENRRKMVRYWVTGRGTWTPSAAPAPIEFALLDISMGGVCFRCERNLALGAQGLLQFSVFCDSGPVAVRTQAQIRYCILERAGHRTGVSFLAPAEADLKAVAAIIAARGRKVPVF
jgi:c-di-GMP-binding flagellar brake protein YcgR